MEVTSNQNYKPKLNLRLTSEGRCDDAEIGSGFSGFPNFFLSPTSDDSSGRWIRSSMTGTYSLVRTHHWPKLSPRYTYSEFLRYIITLAMSASIEKKVPQSQSQSILQALRFLCPAKIYDCIFFIQLLSYRTLQELYYINCSLFLFISWKIFHHYSRNGHKLFNIHIIYYRKACLLWTNRGINSSNFTLLYYLARSINSKAICCLFIKKMWKSTVIKTAGYRKFSLKMLCGFNSWASENNRHVLFNFSMWQKLHEVQYF